MCKHRAAQATGCTSDKRDVDHVARVNLIWRNISKTFVITVAVGAARRRIGADATEGNNTARTPTGMAGRLNVHVELLAEQ